MGLTQGERKQGIWTTAVAGTIAVLALVGGVAGVSIGLENAHQQATQLHLLANAKASSIVMNAAVAEDAALSAQTVQAGAIAHTDQLAAQAVAAKIAAEKAAAAKAAALKAAQEAAAAAQAAQQAAAQQQVQQSAPVQQASAPSAPAQTKCPAGSQANSGGPSGDTSCLPSICFHIPLPDPNHPECATPFKP